MINRFAKKNWVYFLTAAWIIGILLRVLYVNDMEYKEDEEYNFTQSQLIGTTQPWPWYGIPSGVYLVNPGMSIWVFAILAKLFAVHDPTALAHVVQLFAIFGMSLVIPFAFLQLKKTEQETWFWAFALAMVNPFLVFYQRKLWPEPILPFFTMLTLIGWWTRSNRWGAFVWGLVGAWVGQVHMSGFFFSFAIFAWTLVFHRKSQTQWKFWFLGSVLGALPLIPWFVYIIQHPVGGTVSTGWVEAIQLKFWVFWFTDGLGLHLGNPLGLLRGQSNWDQISDFVRYPVIAGFPTYIVGLAHLGIVIVAGWLTILGVRAISKNLNKSAWIGKSSDTAFLQNATFWGCGMILTVTGVMIRRYYMTVTFPLEFIFWIRMAQTSTQHGKKLLGALWICEFVISAGFVGYIHVHEGSVQGDYGKAYHLIQKERQQTIQKQ